MYYYGLQSYFAANPPRCASEFLFFPQCGWLVVNLFSAPVILQVSPLQHNLLVCPMHLGVYMDEYIACPRNGSSLLNIAVELACKDAKLSTIKNISKIYWEHQ